MEKCALDDVEPSAIGDDAERRGFSEPLGTTDVAVNRYRLGPGEGLPGGLHAHVDQEELFVVLQGEATFETLGRRAGPDGGADDTTGGEVVVRAGEAIRFAPGEFQSGSNDGEADLVMLAIGAPRDSDDVRVPVTCPACGHGDMRLAAGADGFEFGCPDCGATHAPLPCPECGHEDLHVTLGESAGTVVVCQGCGGAFESAPMEG